MQRRTLWITLLLFFTLACTLVKTPATPEPTPIGPPVQEPTPTAETGLPNPASAYCLEQGGVLELRQDENGAVSGYCRLTDGTECEEWAFYRGECPSGTPTAQPEVWVTPAPEALQGLLDAVAATQPAQAFDCGYRVLPLAAPPDQAPLWAVYSCGMTNWQLDPPPVHFLAIYTLRNRVWTELARLTFQDEVMFDYLPAEGSVQQITLDPRHVCLQLSGGVGAHGGSYAIVCFDGQALKTLVANGASEPMGAGYTADLNGDGQLDVVLNATDAYVFCYACGVRKIAYHILTWDDATQSLREIELYQVGEEYPAAVRKAVNEAVALARAGLWRDAQAQMTALMASLPALAPGQQATLGWFKACIDLYAQAILSSIQQSGYPLLQTVYYGDYAAAVDMMRGYTPQQIFDRGGPLIAGTAVEMAPETLGQELITAANAALSVKPDLAAAYFLRGWGNFLLLNDVGAARADVLKAAELAPGDPLYLACAAYLK